VGELAYRFPQESASQVLTQRQRIFLLSLTGIFVIWFIFDYPSSFLVLFALINLFYFITNPVKLYIAVQGFGRGKVINVTKKEIESIKDEELPLYTIFVPLYWALISIGCWKGIIQLITRPFYWEKTVHGLYQAK